MNKRDPQAVKERILREKLIAIFRGVPAEKTGRVAEALVKGGVKILEITIDQQAADPAAVLSDSMRRVRDAVGDALCLGCGTVLNLKQLDYADAAGAAFYLSPNFKKEVVQEARARGIVAIPGAMTPTEIADAWEAGADLVKLFPADDLGYHYIRNLRGPLPHIPLLASGGVNPDTIPIFFEYGVQAVGTGVSIVDRALLAKDDYDGLTELARRHVEAIAACQAVK